MGKNWDWSYQKGRQDRLHAERLAATHGGAVSSPPLHSHDGTLQSHFMKGWRSVTAIDIYHHQHQEHHSGRESFTQLRSSLCSAPSQHSPST